MKLSQRVKSSMKIKYLTHEINKSMVEALHSLLLLIILVFITNCPRTILAQRGIRGPINNGTPSGSSSSPLPRLPQHEVDAVNELLQLATTVPRIFNDGNFTDTDCYSEKNSSVKCQCNESQKTCNVVEIDLSRSSLSGQIPETIGNLSYLEALDLSNNQLRGLIPKSFVNLSHLSSLELCDNYLEGQIPSFFAQMKSIWLLSLCDNWFNGSIPHEFGTFPSLQGLDVDNNFLSESIPNELGNISSLRFLYLDDNELSGPVPHELGNLLNLQYLYLANNALVGAIPPSFGNLKSLLQIDLSANNFDGLIPEYISKWHDLQYFGVSGSNFEGPLPKGISKLTNLTELTITDLHGRKDSLFPQLSDMDFLVYLILRNCSLTGPIPNYIWHLESLSYLDLSFNKLSGGIPSAFHLPYIDYIFLRRNNLNGSLPGWLTNNSVVTYVDVSENSFSSVTKPKGPIPPRNKNLFACCSNINNDYNIKWLEANYSCASNSQKYDYLYINCGGDATTSEGNHHYEADLEPEGGSTFFLSHNQAWGYSSMGKFLDADSNQYIINKTCNISLVDAPLYTNARVSPISLKYYGFCLKNNEYTVILHFAEIGWDETRDPSKKRIRVFDVEIQGEKKLTDFNIEAAAEGVNKNITKEFNVTVNNSRLEIHLYWSGKGSVYARTPYYGPLISAISVFPAPQKHHKLSPGTIAGIVGSTTFAVILILVSFWKLGWLGGKNTKNEELKGIELYPGGVLNFRQIREATKNFDVENKIGEGGFGAVYKGVLTNGTPVAVKKLSAKSKQGAREFVNEIGTIYALQHPNLVRLMGCCAEQSELLLVYEYMENNSLDHALFGPEEVKSKLNWLTRVKICRDVAKGLSFLHEESKLKIIHRDIKPTNILLDKDFTAKISDFGYAQLNEEENTRVVTRIAGTTGYMAPEYMLGFLTPKVDVYSFGIVTLEIVSGKNISTFRPKDQSIYLLDTAYDYQQHGNLIALVDSSLGSEYTYIEALKMLELAMQCVNPAPKLRPSMSEVAKILEGIVKVVESKKKSKTTTTSTGSSTSMDDTTMVMKPQQVSFTHSTHESAGSTSLEGDSDTIVYPSTSKEIDDSNNLED